LRKETTSCNRHQPAEALPLGKAPPQEHPDQVEHQRRHDPGQDGLERTSRRHAGDRHPLALKLFGQRQIDARGDEGGLAARKLLVRLELALDNVLADRHFRHLAIGEELLELAVGDTLDRVVGGKRPLQQDQQNAGGEDVADRNGLFARRRILVHFPLRRAKVRLKVKHEAR
jgi:hypothetical protein